MGMKRTVILNLVFACLSCFLFGQENGDRTTEMEINQDKVLIEAKKQALIGNYDNAKQLFLEILKKDRDHDVAAYELARIYRMEKDYENALQQINHALQFSQDERWYLLLKAQILEDQEYFSEAAQAYEILRRSEPYNESYLKHLSFLYTMAEKYEQAIRILDVIEVQHGIAENTSLQKHELYRELGKENEALQVLAELCKKYPDQPDYLHLLANYYKHLVKQTQAEGIYESILKMDPNDARANVALAEKLKEKGDFPGYLRSLKSIISNNQASLDVKIAEVLPYLKMYRENPDEALLNELISIADILEKVHPDDPKVYAFYGDLLSYSEQSPEAIEKYKKTLELDESNYSVWEQMILHQAHLERMNDVVTYSESAMDLFPNKALLYYLHGLGNANLGNYSFARESLEQALLMGGSDPDFRFNTLYLLGKVYLKLGLEDQSYQAFETAHDLKSGHPEFLNDYSYSLASGGKKLDYALDLVNKALKQKPNQPKFLATQAWIYYRKRNFQKAREVMESSINNGGSEIGYILDKYGDILFQLGDADKALEMWKQAKDKGYNSQILDKKITERKWFEEQ
jgi:tetratricopeptide (TPR) repeat protein